MSLPSDVVESALITHRPPGLAVERARFARAPGVIVDGDVDIDTAAQLTQALDAAIWDARGAFVIDLSGVTFLDSSGVSVLVRARAVLGREERALLIACPAGPARRIFELAGIDDLLELFETPAQAAASLQPAV